MGALELFGNIIYLCIGVCIGASIMYFSEVYMDWKEDREEEKRAEAEKFKHRHRNEGKSAKLIPVSFDTYRDGEKKKLKCWKCSICGWLNLEDFSETCDGCGAYFEKEDES